MRYAWLDKMAEEGTIRKEVLEEIYTDCADILEKHAELTPTVQAVVDAMARSAGYVMGTAKAYVPVAKASMIDAETRAKIQIARASVVASFPGKYQEKAEARFNEIANYSPTVASNKDAMKKLVDSKLLGLTDRDVQALLKLEASVGGHGKTASDEATLVGEQLADAIAGLYKDASLRVPFSAPGSLTGQVASFAEKITIPLVFAGLMTGGMMVKKKMDENEMKRNLEASYSRILQMSPNSVLTENMGKSREAFNTLAHFAPHIAVEPNAAKAFMVKLVSYEQGPHASDLKDLTEVQKNVMQGHTGMMEVIQKNLTAAGFSGVLKGAVQDLVDPKPGSVGE